MKGKGGDQKARAPARANPFEIREQRKKHDILGRKTKGDKNKAALSRAAGITVRQQTLGVELQQKGRANVFADQRFAEADETLAEEDKMLLRFQRERQKSLFKKSIFNLQDEEEPLTHHGKALSTLKTFEDDYAASEDDGEDLGEIDEETVNAAHFGGFEPKRKTDGEEDGEERVKTKKEVMEELIAKSKYYRAERAKEKEEHSELKEKLDEEYREIAELLKGSSNSATPAPKEKKKEPADNYDIIVRELAFDLKARPTDRTKTPEELAREERDRLELLEKQRLMRMTDQQHADTAPGGDDLDEGYYEAVEQAKQQELGGDDGLIRKQQTVALPLPSKSSAAPSSHDDLPYTIIAPSTAEELKKLTDQRSARDLRIIFHRILVCTHPSLAPGNKEKLKTFFALLLEYMLTLAAASPPSADHINATYESVLTLVQAQPEVAAEQTRTSLGVFQEELVAATILSSKKPWNHASFIALLQYISNVYPVSDFQHSIVTPALLLAGQFLSHFPFSSIEDVSSGLLLCSVLSSYLRTTRRYFPEVLVFLDHVIIAAKNAPSTWCPSQFTADLRLESASGDEKKTKVAVLKHALDLVIEYVEIYKPNDGCTEAFEPLLAHLQEISSIAEKSSSLKSRHQRAVDVVKEASEAATRRRQPLRKLLRRPPAIKLFNPKYEEKFDPTASYDPDKERSQLQKLKAKLKREQKGAMRELKKDAAFVQAEKEKKRREEKTQVAERLKRAVSALSAQDQEVNLLKQDAKRKKARLDRTRK